MAISYMRETLRDRLVSRMEFQTASQGVSLQNFLRGLHRDLRVVSSLPDLGALVAARASGSSGEARRLREELERDLVVFSQGRKGYTQLRFLDAQAREVLRLDRIPGEDRLRPASALSSTPDPYYSTVSDRMQPGTVYVSQLEVVPGLASGEPSGAGAPVLSCAIPVELDDSAQGFLVVNIDGMDMASVLGTMPAGAEAWILNQDDIYLGYIGEANEKREMYSLARGRSIFEDFDPGQVAHLKDPDHPVNTLEVGETLFTAVSLDVDVGDPERTWTLLVAHPLGPAMAPTLGLTNLLWAALAVLLAVSTVAGGLIAHYVSRPLEVLREATVQIAGGDFSKEVTVTTGDEIEGLAEDFNRMTRHLRGAHDELAGWNARLQREVTEQTERLGELQTGLARADRLATVGQMAASVMHEIGNPLAAIKTKIQVAEEGATLDGATGPLLHEIMEEVDRLSAVLRSFSRLGRLSSTTMGPVLVTEVVQGVRTLIEPELRRRGVSLEVSVPEAEPPAIRGEPDRLRQLLINFVLNAAEASESGGRVLVRVSRSDQEGSPGLDVTAVALEIEDEGVGISPEALQQIWNPLYTTKTDGTGLGLAICREIIDDHGATVHVESSPGEGTVIRLSFPVPAEGA